MCVAASAPQPYSPSPRFAPYSTVPEQIWMMWPRLKSGDEAKPLIQLRKKRKVAIAAAAVATNKRLRLGTASDKASTTGITQEAGQEKQREEDTLSTVGNTETSVSQGTTL